MQTTTFTTDNSYTNKKILKHRKFLSTYNEEKKKIKIRMDEIIGKGLLLIQDTKISFATTTKIDHLDLMILYFEENCDIDIERVIEKREDYCFTSTYFYQLNVRLSEKIVDAILI